MVQRVKPALVPISKPTVGRNNYQGFMPGKVEVLPKGWNGYNQRPIDSDIKVEHDVEVKMRDGARIYMDVYRPVTEDVKVPAIISWSPYGKKYNALTMLAMTPWNVGMVPADISGLEKFEGIDPGLWVAKGYAVINIDARGVGNSDGYVCIMGKQDAEDGHDAIEAIAKLPWCNGAVGMAGNSALAICQWHIAATQPPSLKAIAPWEGSGDLYREQFCRGGTFDLNNFGLIQKFIIQGNEGVEDFQTMSERSKGLMDDWWAEKRADMTKVNIPAYITGSDFGSIHTMGAIRGWLQLNNPNKWIRWARFQEWHDLYADAAQSQPGLIQFFDRYLKGIENDWEKTPRVRWSALQFGDHDAIENIVLPDFPVPDTDYRSFYLTGGDKLSEQPSAEAATVSYDAVDGKTYFTYAFKEKTRLIGLPKAHLFMSCPDNNDFSVTILLEKLDVDGTKLRHCNVMKSRWPVKSLTELGDDFNNGLIMFNGSNGLLRASHRAIDRSKSWHPQFPHHPHDHRDYVEPGKVVELEIGIWAMGVDYQAGQSIRISVSGSNPTWPELKATLERTAEAPVNKGKHIIHFGPEHPSRIILPFVNIW